MGNGVSDQQHKTRLQGAIADLNAVILAATLDGLTVNIQPDPYHYVGQIAMPTYALNALTRVQHIE